MLRKIILFFILIFSVYTHAYQCKYMPPQEKLNSSSYVFTAKIISKQSEVAEISIVKSYKGNISSKIQISFPGAIAKEYKLLEKLEIGEVYLFSSNQALRKKVDLIELGLCSWKYNVKSVKDIISTLDKKRP